MRAAARARSWNRSKESDHVPSSVSSRSLSGRDVSAHGGLDMSPDALVLLVSVVFYVVTLL
jgi:hypothetical protein